ncbi:hypothetical protein [Amycolatopsis silviterrae]|uniref:SMI1/KNR4 family protein n=1 Tax=Amycolatopsis silviterrae TaxID=1656914 RepID=A0ABW5HIA4_9PSEU
MATLRFEFRPPGELGGVAGVPVVDGVALTELIDRFELAAGMSPAGDAYGGLNPRAFAGTPAEHFHGLDPADGKTPLLGCSCGDWGCWPLLARVTVTGDEVVWDAFEQPHRPERDYRGFGPFRFARAGYDAAVRWWESA